MAACGGAGGQGGVGTHTSPPQASPPPPPPATQLTLLRPHDRPQAALLRMAGLPPRRGKGPRGGLQRRRAAAGVGGGERRGAGLLLRGEDLHRECAWWCGVVGGRMGGARRERRDFVGRPATACAQWVASPAARRTRAPTAQYTHPRAGRGRGATGARSLIALALRIAWRALHSSISTTGALGVSERAGWARAARGPQQRQVAPCPRDSPASHAHPTLAAPAQRGAPPHASERATGQRLPPRRRRPRARRGAPSARGSEFVDCYWARLTASGGSAASWGLGWTWRRRRW